MKQLFFGACIAVFFAAIGWLLFTIWPMLERNVGLEAGNITIRAFRSNKISGLAPTEAKLAFDRREAVFVDARTVQAYKAGHLPGALRLSTQSSTSDLRRALMSYPTYTRIIAYCAGESCLSSHALARRLVEDLGYRYVEVLEGGFPAWEKAGYPVDRDDDSAH